MEHAVQARTGMFGTKHGHGMAARAGAHHTDWTKRAASPAHTRMLAHLTEDTTLNGGSWEIRHSLIFRGCVHTPLKGDYKGKVITARELPGC